MTIAPMSGPALMRLSSWRRSSGFSGHFLSLGLSYRCAGAMSGRKQLTIR